MLVYIYICFERFARSARSTNNILDRPDLPTPREGVPFPRSGLCFLGASLSSIYGAYNPGDSGQRAMMSPESNM